jgi:transcriptional regulator NrdR family protein
MKCPECGVWTLVQDSRMRSDGSRRRRYLCANQHKFSTLEVIAVTPTGKQKVVPGLSFYRTETMAELRSIEQTVQRLMKTLSPQA